MKNWFYSPRISIRWLTVSCFEIKIGDKTIVADPFVGLSTGTESTADIIEGADIITITHIHWDHITDVGYLMDKFGSKVIVGDLSAMDFAKYLDRNVHYLYPVSHNTELDFGWAKIKCFMGRHHDAKKNFIANGTNFQNNPLYRTYPQLDNLGWYGALEYRNYLITTNHGFKILIYGNQPSVEQVNMLKDEKPDLALIQLTRPWPKEFAQFATDIGAKIVIPHHMDLKKSYDEYIENVNSFCSEFINLNPTAIAISPEHNKWYDIGTQLIIRE